MMVRSRNLGRLGEEDEAVDRGYDEDIDYKYVGVVVEESSLESLEHTNNYCGHIERVYDFKKKNVG